ncbi:MAG: hypothetical protein M1815_002887 [Lichina confinis]|nr:MAG: hypothetical protein M1815_002887 [Lichina confinis]
MSRPAKRRKTAKVEEIQFDDNARQDYLSGFHKRKLERIKRAQDEAAKKEHAEKLELRRQVRQQRKDEALRHVETVDTLLGGVDGNPSDAERSSDRETGDSEAEGEEAAPQHVNHEEQYLDEDRHTTVTVEAVDVSKEGLTAIPVDQNGEDGSDGAESAGRHKTLSANTHPAADSKGRSSTAGRQANGISTAKKRKKAFRYETKAERKVEKVKQRAIKAKKRDKRLSSKQS